MGFNMVRIRQLFLALVFSILLVSCDLEALSAIMGTMEDNILVDPEDPSSAEEKLKVLTALLEAEDKTVRTDEFCWNEIYQEKFGSEWVEIWIHENDGRLTEWIPFPWGGGKEVEIASWSINLEGMPFSDIPQGAFGLLEAWSTYRLLLYGHRFLVCLPHREDQLQAEEDNDHTCYHACHFSSFLAISFHNPSFWK